MVTTRLLQLYQLLNAHRVHLLLILAQLVHLKATEGLRSGQHSGAQQTGRI